MKTFLAAALSIAGGVHLAMPMQIDTTTPAALIDQATRRMERATAHVRKTGRLADVKGEFALAESEFRSAWQSLSSGREHNPKATLALLRSADCIRIVQRWAEARETYRQVIDLAKSAGEVEYEAKAWLGIAKVEQIGFRNNGEAMLAVERGLRLTKAVGNLEPVEANLLIQRADLEMISGDAGAALLTLDRVVATAQRLGDKEMYQSVLYSRSTLKHSFADALYQTYIKLPSKTRTEWSRCEAVEQDIHLYLADAISDVKQSVKLASELGFDYLSESMKGELSFYEQLVGSVDATVLVKRQEHDQGKSAPPADEQRSLLTSNGAKLVDTNMLGPALPPMTEQQRETFLQNIQSLSAAGGASTVNWRQRYMEGQLKESDGKTEEALNFYREAANLVDQERRTLPTDVSRGLFSAEKAALYDRLAMNLLSRGNEAEAFRWIEQIRGRATADLLSSANLRLPSEPERRLYAELTAARAGKAAALKNAGSVAQADVHLNEVLDRIRRQFPRLLDLVDSQPVTFEQVRQLARDTPFDLIYYMLYEGRVTAWHIGPQGTHVRSYFAPASELQRLAAAMKESLTVEGSRFNSGAAKDLYFLLIAPVSSWIETGRVLIIPPPELQELQFQALMDEADGKFAGEKFAISYAPSASVAARLRAAPNLKGSKALAFLGPGLEHADADAAAISSNFPDHVVIRPAQATWPALLKSASGKTVVHLAAHGRYNPSEPMLSTVSLTPTPSHTGQVTAAELFELPLGSADLVTVAACEAAQTESQGQNEIYGITRSLLYAGAQSVLLPLWKVNDEAAAFWLSAFYDHSRSNPIPKAAMLANQDTLRHPVFGSDPKFWSAFRITGR